MGLYGKLNSDLILKQYDGITTETTKTTVDNVHNVIKVDVLPKEKPIGSLSDVKIRFLENEQALLFNSTTNNWENKNIVIDVSNKLDKNLGIENEGKYLKIDGLGNVIAEELILTTALAQLTDVNIIYAATGNILVYDYTTQTWKNSDKLSILEARVEGSTIAYVFDNYAQLVSWINGEYSRIDGVLPTDLTLNNNIYLKEFSENDYWVSSLPVISIDNLSILKTNKVDLNDYFTKNQVELLLSSYELLANKTVTINEESTDLQYPTAKAVFDALATAGGGIIMELGEGF